MVPIAVVTFCLTIMLPSYPPFRHCDQVDNIIACLTSEMEFLTRAAQRALVDGRMFSARCSVQVEPGIEH